MELKFKNITKCSKEIYNEFLEFHNKKFGLKERMNLIFILIVISYMLVFNIKFKNFKFIVIVVILLLIAFLSYKIYRRENTPKKELKSSKIRNNDEMIYNFYNLYLEVIRNKEKQRIWYSRIYKIHQDDLNFYLYLDETHALLMDKKGFVKGNLEEFKEFISKRCIFKYKKN